MTHITYEEARAHAEADTRTLGTAFLHHVKSHPRATAVLDFRGTMSRLKLAGAALAVFPLLELEDDEENVGVLLPPGQAGALVNVALALAGRAAVNLNFTAGEAQVDRMCRLAHVKTIVSADMYLERIGQPNLPGRVLKAENLVAGLKKASVMRQMARVLLRSPESIDAARPMQVACIIYSSGSTGDPRGVQLTHQQLIANSDAVMAALDMVPGTDVVASPLPLFHSFGLVPGLWMCLVEGFMVAAQADPRDGAALGALCHEAGATVLISTPSFVRGYMRRIEPEQLASLRFGVVGAEKCPSELRLAFKDKYDAELLEGYGATELAPVVTVNVEHDVRDGSVGRPVPGVEVFTMDPDTREILPSGEEGLLVVRSPARMLGYLDRPDLTEHAFVHGGYDTGDIGHVDEDGYVFITGRLARFAKIGGEMVPLDNVETALQDFLDQECPEARCELAVATVPDGRKGERLVVLHTEMPCAPEELVASMSQFPALYKPRASDFHQVEAIPILGTGKRDLGTLRTLAEAIVSAEKRPGAADVVRTIVKKVRPGK